jgi:NADPH:quinone reductase-like Zn-dependent oxidoreductase
MTTIATPVKPKKMESSGENQKEMDPNNRMKALVYHGPGKKAWEDKPKPVLVKPTDAIVKILKTTICGTDLHIMKGDVPTVTNGRIIGHEGVGIIEEVGTSVSNFKKAIMSSSRVLPPAANANIVRKACIRIAQMEVGYWATSLTVRRQNMCAYPMQITVFTLFPPVQMKKH